MFCKDCCLKKVKNEILAHGLHLADGYEAFGESEIKRKTDKW